MGEGKTVQQEEQRHDWEVTPSRKEDRHVHKGSREKGNFAQKHTCTRALSPIRCVHRILAPRCHVTCPTVECSRLTSIHPSHPNHTAKQQQQEHHHYHQQHNTTTHVHILMCAGNWVLRGLACVREFLWVSVRGLELRKRFNVLPTTDRIPPTPKHTHTHAPL